MVMTAEYRASYNDPRWQKLRLEVFDRDEWRCQHRLYGNLQCGNGLLSGKQLHAHRTRYTAATAYEEPIENLSTRCESCHDLEHGIPSLEAERCEERVRAFKAKIRGIGRMVEEIMVEWTELQRESPLVRLAAETVQRRSQ